MYDLGVGYIWEINENWIGVVPLDFDNTLWRSWISNQDPIKRRLVTSDKVRYWMISKSLKDSVMERFLVIGWFISSLNPFGESGLCNEYTFQDSSNFLLSAKGDNYSFFYSLLFLKENAPKKVVDVVYKLLIRECHPDVNSNSDDRAKKLNKAREMIYKKNGW